MSSHVWDVLQKELESTPPTWTTLEQVLRDIKHRVKCIIPLRSKRMHDALNVSLDVDFIMQMLKYDAMPQIHIRQIIVFLISQLEALQSPADDGNTASWKTFVLQQFDTQPPSRFFPLFFTGLILRLKKIRSEIELFFDTMQGRIP